MSIFRAPDFLVAMTTLLTHDVGSSTFAKTPRLSSRSSSALNFSLRAVGTRCEGMMDGSAFSSVCRCTVRGRVPRFFESTSAWRRTSLSMVSIFLMSSHDCSRGVELGRNYPDAQLSVPFVVLYVHLSGALGCQERQQIQWSTSFVS